MGLADADLATVGRALGDPHRARFVLALLGGEDLPAGELAARAGVSSSLASAHLSKLLDAGVLTVVKRGRSRRYRLASPDVAGCVEGLLTIAPHRSAIGLREVNAGQALRHARTCYDHLAGRLGVAMADALEHNGTLTSTDSGWQLTATGRARLSGFGLDTDALSRARRPFIRPCQDWTERRPHLAGALGAALADLFFDRNWIRRRSGSRALVITTRGAEQLLTQFAIRI